MYYLYDRLLPNNRYNKDGLISTIVNDIRNMYIFQMFIDRNIYIYILYIILKMLNLKRNLFQRKLIFYNLYNKV